VTAAEEAASEAALLAERYRLDARYATENGAEAATVARMELASAKRVMSELLRRYEAAKEATREARRLAAAELAYRTQRCAGLESELGLVGAEFHRMQAERAAAAEAQAKVGFVPSHRVPMATWKPHQRPIA
jgi:hypothetical protein